jgi:phage regulator Rha-like protein
MPNKKTAKTARRKSLPEADIELVPQRIAPLVQLIRGEKVLLDADLAELYGVETKALNRAVKRNAKRFPADFMFQLTRKEWSDLRCQFGTSNSKSADIQSDTDLKSQSVTSRHGGRRTPPYAFTEQGVAMLSSVLNSDKAIEVNIAIMRTFVQLRELMANNKMLQDKIERLEKKYDGQFREVFYVIGKILRNEVPDE